jgi:RimJ/RimL family protein N-acetyltransferase
MIFSKKKYVECHPMSIVFQYDNCSITKEVIPGPSSIELLQSITYGTDGPLYQHLDAPQKINHLIRPVFFSLEKEGKAIGTCAFLDRPISLEGKGYQGWYSRYFAIDPTYQNRFFGGLLLKHIKNHFEHTTTTPSIFYGYVDNANPRSKRLLQHLGLETIRNFETFSFSRFFPKRDKRVTRVAAIDKSRILSLLNEQYKNYAFVNFEPLFLHGNYFVLKNGDEIIAGIRANVTKWKIKNLPGISGTILIRLLPCLPLMSRLLNPADFRFIGFEGIYCKEGSEKELFILMESVCAELKLNMGMFWVDPKSELYEKIKTGDWGIVNKLKSRIPANVVAAFRNVPEKEQEHFRSHPAYISAFDLT